MLRHQLTPSCHPEKETKEDHKSASGLILRKFPGKFQENPEIIEFPKSEPFNRKFQKLRMENHPGRNFRKLWVYLARSSSFPGNTRKCCSIRQWKFSNRKFKLEFLPE